LEAFQIPYEIKGSMPSFNKRGNTGVAFAQFCAWQRDVGLENVLLACVVGFGQKPLDKFKQNTIHHMHHYGVHLNALISRFSLSCITKSVVTASGNMNVLLKEDGKHETSERAHSISTLLTSIDGHDREHMTLSELLDDNLVNNGGDEVGIQGIQTFKITT